MEWKKTQNALARSRQLCTNKGKQEGRQAGRQGLGKADTPSNKGTHIRGGKMGDKAGDKLGDKGDKALGTGRQWETSWETS